VYVAGCYDSKLDVLRRIDVYDSFNNLWSSINIPYSRFTLAVFEGHLLTVGGQDNCGEVTSKISRSVDGFTLDDFTTMATPRCLASAITYQRKLIVAGGENKYTTLASTEMFDSITGQWYNCGDLPQPHSWQQFVAVDDQLYLLGGFNQCGEGSLAMFTTSLNDVARHQLEWNTAQDIPWYHVAAVCINGHLVILGGAKWIEDRVIRTKDIHVFNKTIHSWDIVGNLPLARGGPAAITICDQIMVLGGRNAGGQMTDTVWVGSW